MWNQAYLESKILSADALELVRILYEEAIVAVRDARAHLAAGRIAERSAAVSKAMSILAELAASLDMQAGGEISRNLVGLYAYMSTRLAEANYRQEDGPLAETIRLLMPLAEAFQQIRRQPAAESCESLHHPAAAYGQAPLSTGRCFQEPATGALHGWSL